MAQLQALAFVTSDNQIMVSLVISQKGVICEFYFE